MGILFLALSLNPAMMADTSPAGLRVWSNQTFRGLLSLVILGLAGLVPDDPETTLTVTLLIIGIDGFVQVVLDMRRVRADPDPDWSGWRALTRFVSPGVAYLACLWVAPRMWQGNAEALSWLFTIVLLLTLSASSRCWELLKAIGDAHRAGRLTRPSIGR